MFRFWNEEDRLVADTIELARRYGRYGDRRIAALLRDAGRPASLAEKPSMH